MDSCKNKGGIPISWEVIQEYLPLYADALGLTLYIGWLGVLLSVVLGLAAAFIQYFRIPVLRQIIKVYIELFRNTPLLIQLFFLYFGLPRVLNISPPPELCGVAGLGLLGGSYMAEAFRSGLEAVDRVQAESALSLGMTRRQTLIYVIFPQAAAISMPAFIANIIFLLKETSVFSAISLMDLMFTAKDLIGMYSKTAECLVLLVVFYLLILLPVSILGSFAERRLRRGSFGD